MADLARRVRRTRAAERGRRGRDVVARRAVNAAILLRAGGGDGACLRRCGGMKGSDMQAACVMSCTSEAISAEPAKRADHGLASRQPRRLLHPEVRGSQKGIYAVPHEQYEKMVSEKRSCFAGCRRMDGSDMRKACRVSCRAFRQDGAALAKRQLAGDVICANCGRPFSRHRGRNCGSNISSKSFSPRWEPRGKKGSVAAVPSCLRGCDRMQGADMRKGCRASCAAEVRGSQEGIYALPHEQYEKMVAEKRSTSSCFAGCRRMEGADTQAACRASCGTPDPSASCVAGCRRIEGADMQAACRASCGTPDPSASCVAGCRRIEGADMQAACRASCGTPTAARRAPNPHNLYFERQRGLLCGKHAINNALGKQAFTQASLNQIANRMAEDMASSKRQERAIRDDLYDNETGFYDAEVLRQALLSQKNRAKQLTDRLSRRALGNYTGVLLNSGRHWYALRKKRGQWYVLNSTMQGPEPVSVDAALREVISTCSAGREDCNAFGLQ